MFGLIHRRHHAGYMILAIWGISMICVGCGKSTASPARVRGFAFSRGIPLDGGTVVFAPDRDKGNSGKPLIASIKPDGSYQLPTGPNGGVPPGWYRVALSDSPAWSGDDRIASDFPAALRRPDLSGIEREVKAGQDNAFDFLIERTE